MVIHKTLKFAIYPAMFTIAFYDNIEEVIKKCKLQTSSEEFLNDFPWGTISGAWDDEGTRRIIIVFNINRDPTHGSIAHELYHAAARILSVIGHEQDPNNNETEAYLIEWMANQVYDLIKKNRKQLKMFQV